MTAEASECSVSFDKEESDLKGSGGIAPRDGEDNDDSFVIVDRDPEDPIEGDLDADQKPDLVAGPNAGENGVPPVNDSTSPEWSVVGDQEGREGKKGGEGESSFDNGYDGAVGVGQQEEADMGVEEVGNGELCRKDGDKESSANGATKGECCEGNGELGEERVNGILDATNGELHAESEYVGVEVELGVKVEDKAEHESVSTETGTGCEEEAASAVEVEEKHKAQSVITETNQEAEFRSASEVEENQEVGLGATDAEHHRGSESAVKAEEIMEHVAVSPEINPQDESAVEVGKKHGAHTGFPETNQEAEFRSASEVEENQEVALGETDSEHQGSESAVEVEEKMKHEAVPSDTNHQDESAVEAGEKLGAHTGAPEINQQAKIVGTAARVEGKQEPGAVVAEAEHQEELLSAVTVEEKTEHEAVPTVTDCKEESALAVEVGVKGVKADKIAVSESKQHAENIESAAEVEEIQEPQAEATEFEPQGELESAVGVGEKHELEAVAMATEHQEELKSVFEGKEEPAVVETSPQPELVVFIDPEEQQKSEIAITEIDHQMEPESSVELEGKPDVETTVTKILHLVEPEPVVNVEEEELPNTEIVKIDGQETVEVGEKQEPQPAVAETDGRAEPESAKMEEEHRCLTVRGTNYQEESRSIVYVEEKLEFDIAVSKGSGVETKQQTEVAVKDMDVEEEFELATEVESKQYPDIVVAETTVVEMEENCMPEAVIDEQSDQFAMVSAVKSPTIPKTGYVNGSPKASEAISICHVDDMGSATISSGDFLENGVSEPADHIDGHLEIEATINPLESSDSPTLHHVDNKEIVNNAAVRRGIEAENGLAESRVSNCTKLEDGASSVIAASKKDVAVDHDGEMKLENDINASECSTRSVEGDGSIHKEDDEEPTREEVEASIGAQSAPDEPSSSALDGERLEVHAVKRQHFYIIRVPKFSDDELKTKLQHARLELDKKTQSRDCIGVEIQKKRIIFNEYREKLVDAKAEAKTAKAAVGAKRQEIDSIQFKINKMKDATSIEDINEKIRNMEHTLQHESITLPMEKQYIRDIKQLRHQREQLSAKMGPQGEIQEAFNQRDQIEEKFKTLKKELDSLRATVLQAESIVKVAQKKFDDEFQLLKDLQEQFRLADGLRQEAYGHLKNLIKESSEKSKYFSMYKDDQQIAMNYVFMGNREGLQSHCSKQVEKIMELWNNDEEFRKQYVKSNVNSTLRRFRTLDGRSLGLDEEPPILHNNADRRSSNVPLPLLNGSMPVPILELEVREGNSGALAATEQVAQTNQSAKSKKSTTSRGTVMAMVPNNDMLEEGEKEIEKTKEEEELERKAEELARKEEELRREQAEAEMKERHRLEQKAKAKEAEERKKKVAEKALAKAEYRAQKEAEDREKKRAKKGKKKKAASTDMINGGIEGDNAPAVGTALPESVTEPENGVRTAPRRLSKPPAAVKQYHKIPPLPLPLRNRSRRKMQTWMWVLLTTLLVLLMFLAGNFVPFSHLSLPYFGF